jgi:hypothetical protein
MSLLKKASIITTPTAYAEDYLYSIKPAYALGSELVTNGGFESSASWTVSGTDSTHIATFSNGTLRYQSDTTSPQLIVAQASVLQTGRLYKITVNVTTLTSGYVKVDSLGGLNITPSAGTNIFYKTATGTTFNITRGTTNVDVTIDSISVVEVTDADFDFDRNSTGTRVNEDYLIEDVPYNLMSYSEDFSNSYWTKTGATVESGFLAPYGSLNAYKLVEGTNNGIHIMNRILTVVNAQVYSTSIFVKSAERTKFGMRDGFSNKWITVNLSNGSVIASNGLISSEITKAANDWHKISFTLTTASTSATLKVYTLSDSYTSGSPETYFYQGDGSSGVYIWGAQVVKGDQPKDYLKTTDRLDIPRIDYTNGEPSILLEPSRTNLVTYSQDLSQWTLVNGTLTANATVSPEGIQNSGKIAFSSVGLDLKRTITVVAGTTYTISFYIKVEEGTGLQGRFYDNSNSANIEYYNYDDQIIPNQWSRITRSVTAPSGCTEMQIWLLASSTTLVTASWWGAQLEAGSYATSLIHTSGSAVTRSADAANNAGNSDLINSTEGVLYVEASSNYNSSITNRIAISDGTNSNRIVLEWDETTENRIRVHINTHSLLSYDAVDLSIQNKVAIKYAANDYALWFNGQEVLTQASGALPTGMDVLELTGAGLGGIPEYRFYGNVKMVAVFKEALTDLELEKLTGYNNHELYMNYYNRLSYLGLAEEYNVESDINNYIL